uniref:Uncharacterized protein n=1 Tax=Arundo donax TaxID=35708 RepID=A0A0A9AUX5_ARUDO
MILFWLKCASGGGSLKLHDYSDDMFCPDMILIPLLLLLFRLV